MPACLVSVVTPSFVPGALVMLFSFLKHNPWFDGDLLIFHKDLSEDDQRKIETIDARIQVRKISGVMAKMVAKVTECRPELQRLQSSFYKGELLKLTGYSTVIMSDCDIVYTGSIYPVVDKRLELQACGDGSFYRGESRNVIDYSRVTDSTAPELKSTFSAGFVVFSSALLRPELFDRYMAMMERYCLGEFSSPNTDQAIFNVLFDGKLSRLDCIYNYHLLHKDLIRSKTGREFSEAIVLHYGGASKPWNLASSVKVAATNGELYETFVLWRSVYAEYLDCSLAGSNNGYIFQ